MKTNLKLGANLPGLIAVSIALAVALHVPASAQDTRAIKVMFYDFKTGHADFDSYNGGNRFATNMLAFDLPKISYSKGTKKMPRKGTVNFYSTSIEDWYNPDKAAGTACRTLYLQNVGTAANPRWRYDQCTQGCASSCGGGTCQTFFPIDNIPSAQLISDGAHDGKPHNYNWTMELNASFTYRGGETFYFKGDDDLWVFINNRLALDFGGIHDPLQNQTISLDALKNSLGITVGGTYDIDVYFAERKGQSSTFYIESTIDLKPAELARIIIVDTAGNEISTSAQIKGPTKFSVRPFFTWDGEGQCVNYGAPPSLASSIDAQWTLGGSVISAKSGSVLVTPEMIGAGGSVPLSAMAVDPLSNAERTSTVALAPAIFVSPDSAVLLGNGKLESIRLHFNTQASFLGTDWSATASFDGKTFSINSANTTAQGKTVLFSVPAAQVMPSGNSFISQTSSCSFTSPDTSAQMVLKDRMTPAISNRTAPRFTPASSSQPVHVLNFSVSEELLKAGTLTAADISIMRNGTPLNIGPSYVTISRISSTSYVANFALESPVLPWPGDSITLVTSVADLQGNTAVRHTVRIEGESITAAAITYAAYYDRNADGTIDSVILRFSKPLVAPPQGIQIENNGMAHRVDTTKGDRVALLNDAQTATVTIALGTNNALAPNVTYLSRARILLSDQPFQGIEKVSTQSIADLAAPVIVSAAYSVRELSARTAVDALGDTLIVVFTEPARLGVGQSAILSHPFKLADSTGAQSYSLEVNLLSGEGSRTMTFVVMTGKKGMGMPQKGDSIWIDPANAIRDTVNNSQTNAANRRAVLTVTMPPFKVVTRLAPNPFFPGETRAKIVIKPETPLAGWVEYKATAKVKIYDAVGNAVLVDGVFGDGPDNSLEFEWDGKNQNGRSVGSGTYVAYIRSTDSMNGERLTTLKIGVKRR